jgi:hypothetical protein
MEDQEIINLWKLQDAKLDRSLAISAHLLHQVKAQKTQTALRRLTAFKTRGVVVAVIYLILLGVVIGYAVGHYSAAANYFIVSMGAIFLINVKALADYIKHLVWINDIDYDGSVIAIQQRLAKLQLSIINHNRIMVLQLPFWSTFFLSSTWFPGNTPWALVVMQICITGLLTWLAIWLYLNQIPANSDKKWFNVLFNGSGGKAVVRAMQYYDEIEEFKSPPAP